jgi:uncharacterized membrane-anchored protein YjiN (DUF445 family)
MKRISIINNLEKKVSNLNEARKKDDITIKKMIQTISYEKHENQLLQNVIETLLNMLNNNDIIISELNKQLNYK